MSGFAKPIRHRPRGLFIQSRTDSTNNPKIIYIRNKKRNINVSRKGLGSLVNFLTWVMWWATDTCLTIDWKEPVWQSHGMQPARDASQRKANDVLRMLTLSQRAARKKYKRQRNKQLTVWTRKHQVWGMKAT